MNDFTDAVGEAVADGEVTPEENQKIVRSLLSDNVYNILKWILISVIPIAATLWTVLDGSIGFPDIVSLWFYRAIGIVATLLGLVVMGAVKTYKPDGALTKLADGEFRLESNLTAEEVLAKKQVTFEVAAE
jgi:hypothetical protein